MAGDQYAVPGRDQVRLDRIGAKIDGPLVGLEGVFRQVARRTAMSNHQRCVTVERLSPQWSHAAATGNHSKGQQTGLRQFGQDCQIGPTCPRPIAA